MFDRRLLDEEGRLATLYRYEILDTGPERAIDELAEVAGNMLEAPVSAVTLIDRDRQWFKSLRGLGGSEVERSKSFCTHTIKSDQPLIIPDATTDERFRNNEFVTGEASIRSYAGVPLRSPDGYNLGALCVVDTKPRVFDAKQTSLLKKLAARVMDQLELRQVSTHDKLTGVLTRQVFVQRLSRAVQLYGRFGQAWALLTFDIDGFSKINRRYGRAAGDDLLRAIVEACGARLRHKDAIGRLGSDEFGVLLADTSVSDAFSVAERTREVIATSNYAGMNDECITASFSVSPLDPTRTIPQRWLADASWGLMRAKRQGTIRSLPLEPVATHRI